MTVLMSIDAARVQRAKEFSNLNITKDFIFVRGKEERANKSQQCFFSANQYLPITSLYDRRKDKCYSHRQRQDR